MENCPNGNLAKVAKFLTNPYNFVACLPNPYKLSVLGDIQFGELPFCHFLPPNTAIRGKDSKIKLIFYLNIIVFQANGKQPYILFPSSLTFL